MRAVAVYRYAEYVRDDDQSSFDPFLLAYGLALDRALMLLASNPDMDSASNVFEEVLRNQLSYMGVDGDVADLVESGRRVIGRLVEMGIRGRRPRPRLVSINGDAGFYAQPDLVTDGEFIELKAEEPPPPKHTLVQVMAYSLAFPELRPVLLMAPPRGEPTIIRIETRASDLCTLLARLREFALRFGSRVRDRPALVYRVEEGGGRCRYWGPYRPSREARA